MDDVRASAGPGSGRWCWTVSGAWPPDRSREHAIVHGSGGMLTVVGGKLTTYRSMAAEVVDQAMRELEHRDGRPRHAEARTDEEPLPGGETADLEPVSRARAGAGNSRGERGPPAPALRHRGGRDLQSRRRRPPPAPAAAASSPGHRSRGGSRGSAGAGPDGRRRPGPPLPSVLRASRSRAAPPPTGWPS